MFDAKTTYLTQENQKIATFLFHHRWGCIFDWEVREVCEGIVNLLAGQKRLEDSNKDPDMLPKVNKADLAGMMATIINISDYIVVR